MHANVCRDQVQTLGQNVRFLKEYAKRAIIEEDPSLATLDDVRQSYLNALWEASRHCGMTERDVAILLFKGVLPECC